MESTTHKKHIYAFMINHMELSKATTYIAFPSMCGVVWCHCRLAHWTVYFPATSDRWCLHQHFFILTTSTSRESFSADTMSHIIPSWRSTPLLQVGCQHFQNGWVGRSDRQNCPPVIGTEPVRLQYVEIRAAMAYACSFNTIERLQPILSAARRIENVLILCKVVSSLVTSVRKCIQADGKHF
jgi:hypothetical protein